MRFALASRYRKHLSLGLVVGAFALAIVVVNPIRETAFSDDWAYASVVRHLVGTGQYAVSAWLAPNSPFQIYWGALFARLIGFSFSSLRVSTLVWVLPGLASFYLLAQEHGIPPFNATLLGLILLASPLVLLMSFTFMSDIPFLTFQLLGLYLYTRGLRQYSWPVLLLASASASAAILIRQTDGLVLPLMFVLWHVALGLRPGALPHLVAGAALPGFAALYQFLAQRSWALRWTVATEWVYVQNPLLAISQVAWRPMVALQYLALFCLPLTLLAMIELAATIQEPRWQPVSGQIRRNLSTIVILAAYMFGVSLVGAVIMGERGLFPFIPWNFSDLLGIPRAWMAGWTLVTTLGGILLGWIIVQRYLDGHFREIPAPQRLLDLAALGTLGLILIQFQIGDRYLIPLIPYGLIVAGRYLTVRLDRSRRLMTILCVGMLAISSLWVRAELDRQTALWQASELALAGGATPDTIYGPLEWNLYQGDFDAYLQSINGSLAPDARNNYYFRWRVMRFQEARYLISADPADLNTAEWNVEGSVPYTNLIFGQEKVMILRRIVNH